MCQLPLHLSVAGINPEAVGLRKPPKHGVPRGSTPTAVTRDFISDVHDHMMDERQEDLRRLAVDLPFTPPDNVRAMRVTPMSPPLVFASTTAVA